MTYYVYVHTRNDTDGIFYVGMGRHGRYRDFHRRSGWWNKVAKKCGFTPHIIGRFATKSEALWAEKVMISYIGRADLGKGPLVNMTDGGDHNEGMVMTEEWKAAIKKARRGGGNGGVVKHGDRLPPSWVANLSAAKMGNKNPHFGKPTPVSKRVICVLDGTEYASTSRAAAALSVPAKTLLNAINGHGINRWGIRRI